jgi:hypothetical protein
MLFEWSSKRVIDFVWFYGNISNQLKVNYKATGKLSSVSLGFEFKTISKTKKLESESYQQFVSIQLSYEDFFFLT